MNPDGGGLEVSVAGYVRAENRHCIWSGLYMNNSTAFAVGWTTTRFVAVDESAVAASGQYCLAQEHGPLHRSTPAATYLTRSKSFETRPSGAPQDEGLVDVFAARCSGRAIFHRLPYRLKIRATFSIVRPPK
jgi:hypothetical protein